MTPEFPSNDDAPRTPLTLEFSPERLEGDEQASPVVVCEPSFQHDGRIFMGVHPLGHLPRVARCGVHLLPDDARRIRDHLNKLLLEPEATDVPAEEKAEAVDWQARIKAAAERAQRPKRRRRFVFRTEFRIGSFEGVVGRLGD